MKRKNIILKKALKKLTITTTMMFTKKHNKEKNKLSEAREKNFWLQETQTDWWL